MAMLGQTPPPLPSLDAALAAPESFWQALAARLDALGVDEDALRQFDFLGPDLGDSLRLPLQQWKARQQDTSASLCVAFLRLQETLSAAELQQVFGEPLATQFQHTGLALPAPEGGFCFALRLGALDGLRILADRSLHHPDAVMGPSAATSRIFVATAVDSEPWPAAASLLDLGCGGGALALALRSRAATVFASDISTRALQLAAINSTLNRQAPASPPPTLLQGSLFAPLDGRRVHRIVCQPPFLPDTGHASTFSAGGPWGDAITMQILSQLHAHLTDDGRAVLCVEWAGTADTAPHGASSWRDRIQQATAHQPLIGLHCELFRTSAEDYCTLLAPYLFPPGHPAYGEFLKRMLHHYQQQGIHWIDLVLHFLQPAVGCAPVHVVRQVPLASLDFVTAGYADAAFRALRLASAPEDALLDASLRPPAGFQALALDPHQPQTAAVEFAPESLLSAGQLPAPALAVLQAVGGISCRDALSLLPGDAAENVALIRQMLLQGLLFAE